MTMQPEELKELRKRAGLTQGQMADVLCITPQFVGMMERGERPIDKRTAEHARMALTHRVTVGTFGDRFVVVCSSPVPNGRGRSHGVLTQAFDTYKDAEAEAKRRASEEPGWCYVPTR